MITETYYSSKNMVGWHESTGLNFAGHYCFAYWGCGSPCQMSAVVDLKTGLVYDGPSAGYGYQFKRNSRLLVVNPDDPHTGCAGCTTEYWIWDDHHKKFLQLH